jgi:hypothetical protein
LVKILLVPLAWLIAAGLAAVLTAALLVGVALAVAFPNLPEISSKVGATAVKLRATTKGMVNLEDHSHASKTEGRLESRRKKTGTKRNIVTLTTLEPSPPQ